MLLCYSSLRRVRQALIKINNILIPHSESSRLMKKINDEQNIKILNEDSITEFSSLRYGLAVLRGLQTNLKNVKTIEMVKKKKSPLSKMKLNYKSGTSTVI